MSVNETNPIEYLSESSTLKQTIIESEFENEAFKEESLSFDSNIFSKNKISPVLSAETFNRKRKRKYREFKSGIKIPDTFDE